MLQNSLSPISRCQQSKGLRFLLAQGLEVEPQLTVPVSNSLGGLQITSLLNKAMGHSQETSSTAQ